MTIVHWAYSVVVGVATRSGDVTNVPPVAAVNQPENLKPARVGVGSAVLVPFGTVSVASALPPSELKATVSFEGAEPPPPPEGAGVG